MSGTSFWATCPLCESTFVRSAGKGAGKDLCSWECVRRQQKLGSAPEKLAQNVSNPVPSNRAVSAKHEAAFAKEVKADLVAGSGAPKGYGGDAESKEWLYELKTTRVDSSAKQRRQYVLTTATLDKLQRDAFRVGKKMAMGIHIEGHDVVVITKEDWKALSGEGEE